MLHFACRPNVIMGMVLFHTYGWTQQCLRSLRTNFPDHPMVIVDNNPHKSDERPRRESYDNFLGNYGTGNNGWTRYCDAELHWVKSQGFITLIQTNEAECHGHAVDIAFQWACEEGYDAFVHFEPDCLVRGRRWYINLLEAFNSGYWAAGAIRNGRFLISPSIWNLNATRQIKDFTFACIDTDDLSFDTGQYVYQLFSKKNRVSTVETPDFLHLHGGTQHRKPDYLYG